MTPIGIQMKWQVKDSPGVLNMINDYADVYERCILLPSGNVDQMPIALANKMCKKMMFCLTWIGLPKREPLKT